MEDGRSAHESFRRHPAVEPVELVCLLRCSLRDLGRDRLPPQTLLLIIRNITIILDIIVVSAFLPFRCLAGTLACILSNISVSSHGYQAWLLYYYMLVQCMA